MMLQQLLLDIAPYPRERFIRYDTVRGTVPGVENAPDTAVAADAGDTATAAEDFVAGAAGGGDDMTMLFVAVGVVFMALALCLYFVYSYRRSYQLRLK